MNSTDGILNGLYDCSPALLSEISALQWPHTWPYVTVRRPGKCQASKLRVVKTIRVRKEDLEPWIVKSEIKASWSDKNDQLDALLRWFIWSETHELFSRLEQ